MYSSSAANNLPRIALTMGDANGIGPEVLFKALSEPGRLDAIDPIVVGSRAMLGAYVDSLPNLGVTLNADGCVINGRTIPIVDIPTEATLHLGENDARAGRLAGDAVRHAVSMIRDGHADAMVTMPISKRAFHAGGYDFPGHTELLASICGGVPLMILMTSTLRVAIATVHCPIARVPEQITWNLVEERIRGLGASLVRDFNIDHPKIAVLGLNPHAGEDGMIGREEVEIIAPTIARLRSEGISVDGPTPADGFFARYTDGEYDAVLAMYHDQGLIPLKMLARGGGVNFTAGLPIVRTSPDHGTAFGIAGLGIADPRSVGEAIDAAVAIVRSRTITASE